MRRLDFPSCDIEKANKIEEIFITFYMKLIASEVNMALKTVAQKSKESANKKKRENNSGSASKVKITIQVMRVDITKVDVPVVVAGHYKGVAPIRAVGALDIAMGNWISQAGEHGMIGGNLGELFFIPVMEKQIAARTILLGGMGDYGQFSYDDLRYLLMNICYAISALQIEKFATVLIGSGDGGLKVDEAAKGMISGICDGLHHLEEKKRVLKELIVVENNKERVAELIRIFKRFAAEEPFENIELKIMEPVDLIGEANPAASPQRDRDAASFVNRITIERGEDGFEFSALTDKAVVPIRRVDVQRFFTEGIAERLRESDSENQEQFARLLHNYIFPEDFERLISGKPLTLVLDSTTASLPWEMACFGPRQRLSYYGTHLKLTRQFRTTLSSAPGIAPPINKSIKFLVIADPANNDNELRLPKAEAEGVAVVKTLKKFAKEFKKNQGLDITIEERIGSAQCKPVDILALILNETFDVIHFAGHGIFDKKHPNRSGWIFSKNCILSAREIFRARQVPRLVFANACFSAVCVEDQDLSSEDKDFAIVRQNEPTAEKANKKLAGMAESFFERGVQNYIGTGWPVADAPAATFAEVFYEKVLKGDSLGDALSEARKAIFHLGSTWGAYQHYGQSTARLV